MPTHPIIDTHVHLWDPQLIRYPWLSEVPKLNRPYLLSDYRAAIQGVDVESMVFVQCDAQFSAFRQEAGWVAGLAKIEPRIEALVAWAPLEKGAAVREDLVDLKQHALLRGIRRIIQSEPDLEFCLRPAFLDGVRALQEFDLSFDICIDHRHLANVLRFVERVPAVPMILDHIAKPDIRSGQLQPWGQQMRELARFEHVCCKISGVATEADHQHWTREQLKPYIELAVEAFGFDRVMFGGDWPVSTLAIRYAEWIDVLDEMLHGVDEADQRKSWHDNAARIYRIEGSA